MSTKMYMEGIKNK